MKHQYWFALIIAIFIPLLTQANNPDVQTIAPKSEKIYVTSDQILLIPEGIFYLGQEGDFEAVRIVGTDSQGLYIIRNAYYCPGCNRVTRNGICTNPRCSMYGK